MAENGNSNAERLDIIVALLRQIVARERPQSRRMMRLKEASAYLCLSPWQLRRLIAAGELAVIKTSDSSHAPFLIDKNDLDSWIERTKS